MLAQTRLLAATFQPTIIEAATDAHPNEMKFSGTLVRLDEASTKAPNGSHGHKILIPTALAKKKLNTLIGMGVNYSADLESHEPTNKVGVIQKAWIEGNAIKVSGIIWKKDFPDAKKKLKQPNLGMSFEASDIDVEDQDADVWRLSNLCFTGAAILYKASAAYFKTEALAASASMSAKLITTKNGGDNMAIDNKKKKKPSVAASGTVGVADLTTALVAAMNPVLDAIKTTNSNIEGLRASIDASALTSRVAAALESSEEDVDAAGEEDVDAAGMDEEVDAAKTKKKKTPAPTEDDDEEEEDDEDAMDSSADDEDELEDLDEDSMHVENSKPGQINKTIAKKGSKTTVTTGNDKHKTVVASSTLAVIAAQVDDLISARKQDRRTIARLTRELEASKEAISASAESVGKRRSLGSAQLSSLLAKEGIDVSTMQAAGEKISVGEFDAIMSKANLNLVQRVTMKQEAAKIGFMDEGHVSRS